MTRELWQGGLLGKQVVAHAAMSSESYHANVDLGASHSSLQLFRESPAKYAAIRITKQRPPDAPSKAMQFGDALHSLLLGDGGVEGHADRENWRNGEGEGVPHSELMLASSKSSLSAADSVSLQGMAASVRANCHATALLGGLQGCTERVFSCIDCETGIRLKCRPDRLLANGIVADLKTTSGAASPEEFSRTIEKYGYHRQAALYLDVLKGCGQKADIFLFVAVSKAIPYEVGIYRLDEDSVEIGRRENREALARLAECIRDNRWLHEWEDKVLTIGLPAWRKKAFNTN